MRYIHRSVRNVVYTTLGEIDWIYRALCDRDGAYTSMVGRDGIYSAIVEKWYTSI